MSSISLSLSSFQMDGLVIDLAQSLIFPHFPGVCTVHTYLLDMLRNEINLAHFTSSRGSHGVS